MNSSPIFAQTTEFFLPLENYSSDYSSTINSINDSEIDGGERNPFDELNIPYALVETLVAVAAVIGNAAVIIVFTQEKRLQRRTNYYIVSLAFADFLVGLLGVPFAIMASVGLPRNLHACLGTITILVALCTISIFCLVGVSVDRYWAILHPIKYSKNVSTRTAISEYFSFVFFLHESNLIFFIYFISEIISLCWIAGSIVGFLPLFGWHQAKEGDQACLFVEIMDYSYLVFLYFLTIITPAVILAAFYAHIYSVIIRQMKGNVPIDSSKSPKKPQIRRERGGTMLRTLGAAQKREVKATQNLSIIVLFFMICWVPLYTVNAINAFCNKCLTNPILTYFCIILSHLNSALNPILYAYHLRDFRKALKTSMMRLCGMKIPPEPNQIYKVSLVQQNHKRELLARRCQSQPTRIFINSKSCLNVIDNGGKNSPSPRAKHATHIRRCVPSSIVNYTVDTQSKIWQSLDLTTTCSDNGTEVPPLPNEIFVKISRTSSEESLKCEN